MRLAITLFLLSTLATPGFTQSTPTEGDALPEGVIGRLGSDLFRHARAEHIAFSPDGKLIAATGRNLRIFDSETGRVLHQVAVDQYTSAARFSPDCKKLFAGTTMVDVATGKTIKFKVDNENAIATCSCVFSPDGDIVASAILSDNRTIIFWDAATGKEIRRVDGIEKESFVNSIAFSPADGNLLATANFDSIRLWNVATGKLEHRFTVEKALLSNVGFALKGAVLVASDRYGFAHLWDFKSREPLRRIKLVDKEELTTIAISPDGKTLASSGFNSGIRPWDLESGKKIRSWKTNDWYINSLAFAPDGKTLASSSSSAIRRWNIETGKEINPLTGHSHPIRSLSFSNDGEALLSSCGDNKLLKWDLTSKHVADRWLDLPTGTTSTEAWYLTELSADGKILAQTSVNYTPRRKHDPVIRLWNTATGKEIQALAGHKDRVESVKFSSSGALLASSSMDGIRIWKTESGAELHYLLPKIETHSVAFTSDGRTLFSASADQKIRRWDVDTGRELNAWMSEQEEIYRMAVSPDGRFLATSDGTTISIWDATNGKAIAQIFGSRIFHMAFSSNGRTLAFAGRVRGAGDNEDANSLQLWETHTGHLIREIVSPQGQLNAFVFAPNGRSIALGGSDSTILLWDLTGLAGKNPAPLNAVQLDALWSDLHADAAKADRALWTLALSARQSVPFLKERLQAKSPADEKLVANLLVDLENRELDVRQKAERRLVELGESVESALRKRLETNSSLELRRRILQVLAHRDLDVLRQFRAIDTLEQIGTSDVCTLLQTLAKSTPNPGVAQAAESARTRLENK